MTGDIELNGLTKSFETLAAAMLGHHAVLVLDEPTNGLDPPGVRWLRGYVRRLADEGRTPATPTAVRRKGSRSTPPPSRWESSRRRGIVLHGLSGTGSLEQAFFKLIEQSDPAQGSVSAEGALA